MATPISLFRPVAGERIDPTSIDATGATLGDVLTAVSDGSGGKRAGYAAPSGGGAVSSVFGRTGAVVAAASDYTIAQIAGLASVAANTILAGPTSGGSAAAAMRALVAADIPSLDAAKITTGVFPIARLATGTPDGTKFIRDDGTLVTPSGSSTVQVRKNSTGSTYTRPRINLIEGSNVTLTVADDGTDNEVDVTIAASGGGSGKVAQVVNTQTGAVATGTTVIPFDNTIPQNTEGDEYMSLAITPTNASSKLKIEIVFWGTNANINHWLSVALFQDSTANALAAFANFQTIGTAANASTFTHYMTAGTTSATTFKVRAGPNTADTVTFNGQSGGRIFGGVMASSITITEILP